MYAETLCGTPLPACWTNKWSTESHLCCDWQSRFSCREKASRTSKENSLSIYSPVQGQGEARPAADSVRPNPESRMEEVEVMKLFIQAGDKQRTERWRNCFSLFFCFLITAKGQRVSLHSSYGSITPSNTAKISALGYTDVPVNTETY